MSVHHKVQMTVVPFECSERDCEHWSPLGSGECPESVWDVCEECTEASREYHEGPVVTWDECWLTTDDPECECGCRESVGACQVEPDTEIAHSSVVE